MLTFSFKIHGLDCAEEVALLKKTVGPLVGGEEQLAFEILRGRMTVHSGDLALHSQAIMDAVSQSGMRAEVWGQEEGPAPSFWSRHERTLFTVLSGLGTLAGFAIHAVLSDQGPGPF